jgi:DNA mismatch repair ATPase MutS
MDPVWQLTVDNLEKLKDELKDAQENMRDNQEKMKAKIRATINANHKEIQATISASQCKEVTVSAKLEKMDTNQEQMRALDEGRPRRTEGHSKY